MTWLKRFAVAACATLATGGVVGTMPGVAGAAAASVPNGISTSDLNSIGVSPAVLANALVGTGVSISNVHFTGANAQAGLLHVTDPGVVGFNDGIILSSGNVADVMGPNSTEGITGDMGGAADADLTALIQNSQTVLPMTFDAAVLEFDFVPTTSSVYFTYAFGSDEYLEWVNLFDDVFAFYVNGSNCATAPGGEPVSINTINDSVNAALYRDNSFVSPPPNPINIESDGLSVELICQASVTAGQVNHLKLAIADTSDQILDSVVMIKAHSLTTTPPESCNDSVDNDDDLLIDIDDDQCSSTVTPPPPGSSGMGSGGNAPPFTGIEGTPVILDASALGWMPSSDTLRTTWTVTGINGTVGTCTIDPATPQPVEPDGTAAVVTALCPEDGEYVARVDGWDVEGKGSWDTDVDFFVHNAPPAVSIGNLSNPTMVDVGENITISAPVADPGTSDSATCTIEWGDGASVTITPTGGLCEASHAYASAGPAALTVTATDEQGDSSAAAVLVDVQSTVVNTPPMVSAGGGYTGGEGAPITLIGTASDTDGDPLTTSWSFAPKSGVDAGGQCTAAEPSALMTTVVCSDNGTFTATLVADDGTATSAAGTTITVTNAAPAAVIVAPTAGTTVKVGSTVAVSATVTDPAANDTISCTVAWGDGTGSLPGTVSAGVCTASHVYTAAATSRTIKITARDDDAASASTSRTIVVAAAPTITSLSRSSGVAGTTVTIRGTGFTSAAAVQFNGVAAAFKVVSATSITAVVPSGATSGAVTVVTSGGAATSSTSFVVLPPAPTIASFTPASSKVGGTVSITGTNFSSATAVKVNSLAATTFSVVSPTTIVFTIPTGAKTGPISVVTPGGTAKSVAKLTITLV